MQTNSVDSGRSWVVLLACFINMTVCLGVGWNCGVYVSAIISYYHSSRATGFTIGAISHGVLCASAPVASVLIDKTSHRTVAIIGAFFMSLGLVLSANVPSIYLLYLTFAITAIGCGFLHQASTIVLMFYFKRYLALANSIAFTGAAVGSTLYPILSQLLIDTYTWQPSFYIVAGICLNTIVGSMLISPVSVKNAECKESVEVSQADGYEVVVYSDVDKTSMELNSDRIKLSCHDTNDDSGTYNADKLLPELNMTDDHPKMPKTQLHHELRLLKNVRFLLLMFSTMLTVACSIPIYILIPDLYAEQKIYESDQKIFYLTFGLCNIVGRVATGVLWMKYFPAVTVFFASVLLLSPLLSLYIIQPNFTALLITNGLVGLVFGTRVACGSVAALETCGLKHVNRAWSYIMLTQGISGFITPPLLGAVFDSTGSYTWPMVTAAMLGVLATIVMAPNMYLIKTKFKTTKCVTVEENI